MISGATTRISILRGQSEDEWGDPVDNDTVEASGIAASITEVNQEASTETTGAPRVIRKAILRVGSEVDLRTNDRIYDEWHEETWTINFISRVQNPVCAMDTKAELQRVD